MWKETCAGKNYIYPNNHSQQWIIGLNYLFFKYAQKYRICNVSETCQLLNHSPRKHFFRISKKFAIQLTQWCENTKFKLMHFGLCGFSTGISCNTNNCIKGHLLHPWLGCRCLSTLPNWLTESCAFISLRNEYLSETQNGQRRKELTSTDDCGIHPWTPQEAWLWNIKRYFKLCQAKFLKCRAW